MTSCLDGSLDIAVRHFQFEGKPLKYLREYCHMEEILYGLVVMGLKFLAQEKGDTVQHKFAQNVPKKNCPKFDPKKRPN